MATTTQQEYYNHFRDGSALGEYQELEQRIAELRREGIDMPPVLDVSPCLMHKETGEIHEWTEMFASRSDLMVNCDEQGRTDPQYWMGKRPRSWKDGAKPPEVVPGPTIQYHPAEPEVVVPGTEDPAFTIDYKDNTIIAPALDITESLPPTATVVEGLAQVQSIELGAFLEF